MIAAVIRQPPAPQDETADRPERDLRHGRAIRRQPAQERPPDGHALQHLYAAWPSAASRSRCRDSPRSRPSCIRLRPDALYFVSPRGWDKRILAHPHRAQTARSPSIKSPAPGGGKADELRASSSPWKASTEAARARTSRALPISCAGAEKTSQVTREPGGTRSEKNFASCPLATDGRSKRKPCWCSPRAASTSHRSSPRHSRRAAGDLRTALPTRPTAYQGRGPRNTGPKDRRSRALVHRRMQTDLTLVVRRTGRSCALASGEDQDRPLRAEDRGFLRALRAEYSRRAATLPYRMRVIQGGSRYPKSRRILRIYSLYVKS